MSCASPDRLAKRRRPVARGLLVLAALLPWAGAPAQDDEEEDLTSPPRLDTPSEQLARPPRAEAPPAAGPGERPGAARLAEPPQRAAAREEVVVVGEQRWRLPDLGSEWRRRQEEEAGDAPVQADFFVPYDPNDPTNTVDPFPLNSEMRRVGYIQVFRIRFGDRR